MSKPKTVKKRNYHMCLSPVDRERQIWRCDYCGKSDQLDNLRSSDCAHVYKVCDACGDCETSNECKPDCPKMLGLLADPSVYIAGLGPPRERNA